MIANRFYLSPIQELKNVECEVVLENYEEKQETLWSEKGKISMELELGEATGSIG